VELIIAADTLVVGLHVVFVSISSRDLRNLSGAGLSPCVAGVVSFLAALDIGERGTGGERSGFECASGVAPAAAGTGVYVDARGGDSVGDSGVRDDGGGDADALDGAA
jgi:hypothetical protein